MKGTMTRLVTTFLATLMIATLIIAAPAVAGLKYDKEDSTNAKIWKKLGRGVVNDLTFWVELPLAWVEYVDQRDPFTAITFGTADGIVQSADRGWGGLYETIFFPIASPRYYKPVLDPETLFDD